MSLNATETLKTLLFRAVSRIISTSFMNKKHSSIDGFIPRRAGSELGERHEHGRVLNASPVKRRKELKSENDLTSDDVVGRPRAGRALGGVQSQRTDTSRFAMGGTTRSDIAASLDEIDDPDQQPKKKLSRKDRRRIKKESRTRAQRIRRRIILGVVWGIVLLIVAAGGYLAYKALNASSNVLQGNIFDIVQNEPLKEDENGRSNFLIFGTAEDDEGGEHGGANLTDSIMVVSVNQTKKDAYMLSLPRDLWSKHIMPSGEVCTTGYQGKLNEQYFCASGDGADEPAGAAALRQKAGEITGLDIQYYVHLNFTAVVDAVDAVGGVEVVIESDDPRGIFDDNFDWKCNYTCNYVKYANGPTGIMDGEHALALARARGASGNTYGLGNANFDREKNQQKIIKALVEKASSAGTLTNLGAVTGLIDALGNNLRTNIQTKEIRTLMDLGTKIPQDSIKSLSLVEEGNMLVMNDRSANGQSIVRPIAGLFDYSDINAYVRKEILSEPYMKEEANILVLNGSGAAGVAQTFADILSDKSFVVSGVDNAPDGTYEPIEIYQITTDNPATTAKLEALYGVKVKTTTPPASVVGDTDFLIIIGNASVVE